MGYRRARIYKTSKRLHTKPSLYKFAYATPPLIYLNHCFLFLHTAKLNYTKKQFEDLSLIIPEGVYILYSCVI
jgi:hypothetical protein